MENQILKSTANLIRAIKNNDEVECRRILETEPVDIHRKDSEIVELENEHQYIRRSSPIVIASDIGNSNIVEMLLENGANINDTDECGSTALMKASIYNHINIIKLLLSKGVDIHEKNIHNGATAILYACLHSQKETIQLLLSNGASIYDTIGNTGNIGSNCYNTTFNKKIKFILKKWPIIMPIIMFKELLIYTPLDYLLLDLQEYMDENDIIDLNEIYPNQFNPNDIDPNDII
jgi:ankyrin repeat protein